MAKNLVGTTYIHIGDIVKEEERRAFTQRTRMAGKVAIEVTVKVKSTGQTMKIAMTKGSTIGDFKALIQDKVGIQHDQLLLQFPGGNPTDGMDAVHLWQVSNLMNEDGWRLLNDIEEVKTSGRVMIEDACHGMMEDCYKICQTLYIYIYDYAIGITCYCCLFVFSLSQSSP